MLGKRRLISLLGAAVMGMWVSAGAWAESFTDCPDCPEMIALSAGIYLMGAERAESVAFGLPPYFQPREQPRHEVTITTPFAISKYEITQRQFTAFAQATGYNPTPGCWAFIGTEWIWDEERSWRDAKIDQTADHPVTCINWHDAVAYVDWLSQHTGQRYRLLSEAEWEYAARAGTSTPYWFGASTMAICDYINLGDITTRDAFGWHETEIKFELVNNWTYMPCTDGHATTAPVTFGQANPFGIFNMLGNVTEWTADCWHENYDTGPSTEVPRQLSGDCGSRVMRGQGWTAIDASTRAAFRGKLEATSRRFNHGIRVAREIP